MSLIWSYHSIPWYGYGWLSARLQYRQCVEKWRYCSLVLNHRCNNTWHVESSFVLQSPKYLLLFVNRFRYINTNVTIDAPYLWMRPVCFVPLNISRNLWVGWCVSSWWHLLPSRSSVLIYIYIYIYLSIRMHFLNELHPITFYRNVFGGSARFLGWMPLFVFFGLPIVSCSIIDSLIPGWLWPLVFVLNNILILGIWRSAISHLPGSFCPWTSIQNIGFNMVPSGPLMSHLSIQLGYSAGEFRALQLIVLAAFGVVD